MNETEKIIYKNFKFREYVEEKLIYNILGKNYYKYIDDKYAYDKKTITDLYLEFNKLNNKIKKYKISLIIILFINLLLIGLCKF